MKYSFLIYKIKIQLHISLSNSHSDSTTKSLFNITTLCFNHLVRYIGPTLLVKIVRSRHFIFIFILLLYCRGVLPPCGAGTLLDAAASNGMPAPQGGKASK
jgi:hypothetical protein